MIIPPKISWRHMPPSEPLEARILEEVAKLETFFGRVVSCRVTVEQPHLHKHKGRHFRVRVELGVPGKVKDVVVTRDPAAHKSFEDPYLAVAEAFTEARRQLQDHVKRVGPRANAGRERPDRARVARLFSDHGFLQTPDAREIYFHRNAVVDGAFDRLEPGTEVRLREEKGDEGPQASTVAILRKRRRANARA